MTSRERRRQTTKAVAAATMTISLLMAPATPVIAADPGDLDASFGVGGIATGAIDAALGPIGDFTEGFAVLPGDRYVLTGYLPAPDYSQADVVVAVFDEDGNLDPSFSGDGVVSLDFGAYDEGDGAVYQPGRGIVVVGYSSGQLIATRLELDGDVDTTFGTNGFVHFLPFGDFGYAWKVALDAQDRIVFTGQTSGTAPHVLVGRLDADGDLDPTFGSGGLVDTGVASFGSALFIDGSGRIVTTAYHPFNVVRLTDSGTLDPTFDGDGIATITVDTYQQAYDVTVDAHDRVVVVGTAHDGASGSMLIARFTALGALDATFDGDGSRLIVAGGTNADEAVGVELDDAERILVAGRVQNTPGRDFALLRLLDDGSSDPSFAGGGILTTDLGADDFVNSLGIDGQGRVVLAGNTGDGTSTGEDMALVRYLPGGSPDIDADGTTDDVDADGGAGTGPAGAFFDDTGDGHVTEGTIVDLAGLTVAISDSPDPEGVHLVVSPGTGFVTMSVCGGQIVEVEQGTDAIGTCGSTSVRVTTGEARVVLGGGLGVVTIPTGGAATVSAVPDGTFTVSNTGSVQITLTIDGVSVTIPVGGTSAAAPWDFVGYATPIDNRPVLNRVKAGQAVPVKWRLLDAHGQPITSLASARLTVTALACSAGESVDQIEETATGSSGLQNLGNGYYQLNWRSSPGYAKSCKTLRLDIGDGVTHDALFEFTK